VCTPSEVRPAFPAATGLRGFREPPTNGKALADGPFERFGRGRSYVFGDSSTPPPTIDRLLGEIDADPICIVWG